ncbi:MAG TPA: hypothetical protein VKS99_04055, partial [Blastocatellia bacterium]|nr:hypothetical protein [Blastocatellia bacterium]
KISFLVVGAPMCGLFSVALFGLRFEIKPEELRVSLSRVRRVLAESVQREKDEDCRGEKNPVHF